MERYFKEAYEDNFNRANNGRLKLSLDFPVIRMRNGSYGNAAETKDMQRLIRELGTVDESWKVSEMGFFAEKKLGNSTVRVGSDFRSGVIEVKLPLVKTLDEAAESIVDVMKPVARAAEQARLGILAYGTHPVAKATEKLLMPNSKNRILSGKLNDRMYYLGLVASEKVHVRVTGEEMPLVNNVLNYYSPAIISLTANSAIIKGRGVGFADYRGIVTDMVDLSGKAKREENVRRKGIMEPIADIGHYMDMLLDFSPIFTVRNNKPVAYTGLHSFRDFIDRGSTDVVFVCSGERLRISPMVEDFYYHERTCWTDSRPRGVYGTVELAAVSMQSSVQEMVAVGALALGLAANAKEAWEYISKVKIEELKTMRRSAMIEGISGDKFRYKNDVPLEAAMLYFAETGLEMIGESTRYLDTLFVNLKDAASPALRSTDLLRKKGIEAFIESVRVKA